MDHNPPSHVCDTNSAIQEVAELRRELHKIRAELGQQKRELAGSQALALLREVAKHGALDSMSGQAEIQLGVFASGSFVSVKLIVGGHRRDALISTVDGTMRLTILPDSLGLARLSDRTYDQATALTHLIGCVAEAKKA